MAKQIEITLLFTHRDGPVTRRLKGYATDTPGLVVHRDYFFDDGLDNPPRVCRIDWTVSNTSGYRGATYFPRLKDALAFAKECGDLDIDWHKAHSIANVPDDKINLFTKLLRKWRQRDYRMEENIEP